MARFESRSPGNAERRSEVTCGAPSRRRPRALRVLREACLQGKSNALNYLIYAYYHDRSPTNNFFKKNSVISVVFCTKLFQH